MTTYDRPHQLCSDCEHCESKERDWACFIYGWTVDPDMKEELHCLRHKPRQLSAPVAYVKYHSELKTYEGWEKIGTFDTYEEALASIKKYRGGSSLCIHKSFHSADGKELYTQYC